MQNDPDQKPSPAPPEDTESELLRPGFASAEPEDADAEPVPANLQVAHYADMSAEQAERVWVRETLCATCLHSVVCSIPPHTETPRVVISRCLAYLPVSG